MQHMNAYSLEGRPMMLNVKAACGHVVAVRHSDNWQSPSVKATEAQMAAVPCAIGCLGYVRPACQGILTHVAGRRCICCGTTPS